MLLDILARSTVSMREFWKKNSRAVAVLSAAWLCGIFILPIVIATEPLAYATPAATGTGLDGASVFVLVAGICLLLAPRYERFRSPRGTGRARRIQD